MARRISVWVIDDNITRRKNHALRYRAFGAPVHEVGDLASAQKRMPEIGDQDLVILDMHLPIKRGGTAVDSEAGYLIAAGLRARGCSALIVRYVGKDSLTVVDHVLGIVGRDEMPEPRRLTNREWAAVDASTRTAGQDFLSEREAQSDPVRPAAASVGIMLIGFEAASRDEEPQMQPAKIDMLAGGSALGDWLKPAIIELSRVLALGDLDDIWRRLFDVTIKKERVAEAARRFGELWTVLITPNIGGAEIRPSVEKAIKDFVLLFRFGRLNFADVDPWFNRRGTVNHDELGRLEMAWRDRNRRTSMLRASRDPNVKWSTESRFLWVESFRRWPVVEERLLALVAAMEREFKPLRPAENLLQGMGHQAEFSVAAARRYLARLDRYAEWQNEVREITSVVSACVSRVKRGGSEINPERGKFDRARRRALDELSSGIERLRKVVAARCYFNHATRR